MDILVPDTSFSQSSCEAKSGFPPILLTCQFSEYEKGQTHFTMLVLNAFRQQPGTKGALYSLVIPGVQNPIETAATDSFIFTTYTQDNYEIDHFEGANI